jgi:hypothetical protein
MKIRKPKYKKCVLSPEELSIEISQMKQKYQDLYPAFTVDINVDPNPSSTLFDGRLKEFSCQAEITCL